MIKVTNEINDVELIVHILEPGETLPPLFTPETSKYPRYGAINLVWDVSAEKLFEFYDNLIPNWQEANRLNWSSKFQEVLQEAIDEGIVILKMRDVCD